MFKSYLSAWCLLVYFIILLSLKMDIAESHELNHPAPEFSRHRIVQPTVHHGRTKREITSTRHTTGIHHRDVTVRVDVDGEEYVLDLHLNEDLVSGNHIIRYQKDGKTLLHKPNKEELDICQYSGTVRGKKGSWVAVSTCNGIRGIINDGKRMLYIEPALGSDINSKHYVYSHSNNTTYDPDLLKEHSNNTKQKEQRERSRISRYKRDTKNDTVLRGPFNANKLSRYVELVLVVDHREYLASGESIETVHRQLKDVANILYSIYAPLNIFIALVGVVVWTERDEILLEEDGDKTLTSFLYYRRNRLVHDIPNDNAQLLTRQKFQEGVVGRALPKPICTYQNSGGVATNNSPTIGIVATTIAHNMGHNFEIEHDTEDCKCEDEKCIMSPSSSNVVSVHWSSCSRRSLALTFAWEMDYCLRNKPMRLFESPTCGNGFVEPGEQCDCGLQPSAACSACCHPRACLLRSNATCAVGECCDSKNCRPKSAGTVCRSADKECDLPEFCTGHSEYCPRDVFKMDTTPCAVGQSYCVQGSCRTHNDQCRLLWGPPAYSSDWYCYTYSNQLGDKSGNCGQRRGESLVYYPCAAEDTLCGLLQCQDCSELREFATESEAQLSLRFINNNGSEVECTTAIVDLVLSDVKPGMVPDGAKCGENKMCLKQRCVSVDMIADQISQRQGSDCPSNCSGHGLCNSEGHCHCEPGFAPPLCNSPGAGGSIDSGPTTDLSIL